MPFYDYKCPECGAEREVQHSMSEVGKIEVFCHECHHKMNKKLSMPSLIGFDDIGRSGRKNDADKKESSQKEKSTSETKSDTSSKKGIKSSSSAKKDKAT
jgi:putative FmdB family regulatory protein